MSTQAICPTPPRWVLNIQAHFGNDPYQPITFLNKGEKHWQSNIGPQTWGLWYPFSELLCGGRRGGGKSVFLIAKAAMGDIQLPKYDPAHYSYLNDKDYVGLLLREEYQSMSEFVEQAIEFYKAFGGKPAGDPKYIKFPSGARIYFNHLGDEEAYTKYKGWNLTFIGIEELTQVPTLKRYLKLLGSLRSSERIRKCTDGKTRTLPGLRTQIVSTTNPDGPGAGWVKDRFVYPKDKNDNFIPWNTVIKDSFTGDQRIFIPFAIENNPYLSEEKAEGRQYRARLMAQDEVTRKQWMDGDWNAGTGLYFSEYRPKGPITDEERTKYPWAKHITEPVPLKPWWYRWGSGDWGFDHPAAFHKACRNESDGRVHIYDELQVRNMDSFELGAVLARWWYDDLLALQRANQDPCIVIHMGKDVFDRDDATKTKAQRIEAGIKEVLGPYGALLLKYDDDERALMMKDPKRARLMFERRKQALQGNICIALKPVYFERVTAWSYYRELLRWRPAILADLQTSEGRNQHLVDVLAQQGREAYELQAADLRNIKPEVLPKLQIWSNCFELDRCLNVAQKDDKNDDDPSKISKREDVKKANADIDGKGGDDALECLTEDAMVSTDNGLKPIKYVQAGDYVWTRAGLRKVMLAGLVDPGKETISVEFSNGARLTGTRNHLVHTPDRGFIHLESLSNGDIVDTWQSRQSFLTELNSAVTQNRNAGTYGTTIGPEEITVKLASGRCIRRSGARPMGQYLMDFISTMWTKTHLTKILKTLTASLVPTTCESMASSMATICAASSTLDRNSPQNGIAAKLGATSEKLITRHHLPSSSQLSANASSAPSSLCPGVRVRISATLIAKRNGEGITARIRKHAPAWAVGIFSTLTSSARQNAVPVFVRKITVAGKRPVYDLSVDGQPEYYANGVLVHNSSRNLLLAFKEIETTIPKSYFVSDQMTRIQEKQKEDFGVEITDPTRLSMIAATQAARYDKTHQTGVKQVNFPRPGSMRHRVN